MMIQLLKKDWRVNRAPVIGALSVLLAIYFIATLSLVLERKSVTELLSRNDISNCYFNAANTGLAATFFIAGAIGGVSFAVERRERSADFLGLLPVSRRQIMISKTVVGISICIVLWAINCAAGFVALKSANYTNTEPNRAYQHALLITLIFTWMTFGTSWLLSTFLPSPTFACCIALGFTFGSNALIGLSAEHMQYTDPQHERMINWIFISWSVVAGLVSYVAGIIYYMRRVEP